MCKIKSVCLLVAFFMFVNLFVSFSFSPKEVYASSRAYYISSSGGNDNNTGTSSSSPWKTFNKLPASLNPGDVIYLKSGDVFNQSLSLTGSGTASTPITITSYGTGSKPQLKGTNKEQVMATLFNVSNWNISNITFSDGKIGLYLKIQNSGHKNINVNNCDFFNFYDTSYTLEGCNQYLPTVNYQYYFAAGIFVGGNLSGSNQYLNLLDNLNIKGCNFSYCAFSISTNWFYPEFYQDRLTNVTLENLKIYDLLVTGIDLHQTNVATLRNVDIINSALTKTDSNNLVYCEYGVAGFFFHGVKNLYITGCDISQVNRGNSPDGCGVDFEYCNTVVMENSTIQNCDGSAVLFLDTEPWPGVSGHSINVSINSSIFTNNRIRVYKIPYDDIDYDIYSRNANNSASFNSCTFKVRDTNRVISDLSDNITFKNCSITKN